MNIKKRELTKTINCCGTGKQCRDDFKWRYSFVLLVFFHSILVENMTHLRFKSYSIYAGRTPFSEYVFVR